MTFLKSKGEASPKSPSRRRERKSKEQLLVQPGSVVEATAHKESEKVKYGIVFHRSQPMFPSKIESIRPEGLFHRKGLQPEMYLLEVNGEEATWKSPKELAFLLRDAPVGSDLSIKATTPKTVRVDRDSETTSWGFSIKNSTTREGIYVDNVATDGLAASSGLEHGMLILKINNGETFPNNLKEVAKELRSQGNSLELMVVQLEIAFDIDVDACAGGIAGINIQEARDHGIELNHPNYETRLMESAENEIRDDTNDSPLANTENEIRDESTNIISPVLSIGSQDEVLDLDDITYAESSIQTPIEEKKKSSRTESRKGSGRGSGKGSDKGSGKPSSSWFSKEEQCFDLDDQFPERYTESNKYLSQTVFPASKKSRTKEVMMQLRKIRKPIANKHHSIVTIGQSDYAPSNTSALIFGQKKQVSLATIDSFNPQKRRPRFFSRVKSKSNKKLKEDEKKNKEETNNSNIDDNDDVFDWLLSLPDLICTSLFPEQENTAAVAKDDIMSVTSATSRRSILKPVRFRRQRTAAEIFLRNEEVLEL